MSYYEIRYLNKEEDEVSEFADFQDEAQNLIDELLDENRTIISVIECTRVTELFRIEKDETAE